MMCAMMCAMMMCAMMCGPRSVHRSLAYPYLRMWHLAQQALNDTAMVFTLGRRCILRCLLHVHKLFEVSPIQDLALSDVCIVGSVRGSCTRFHVHGGQMHELYGCCGCGLPHPPHPGRWALALLLCPWFSSSFGACQMDEQRYLFNTL